VDPIIAPLSFAVTQHASIAPVYLLIAGPLPFSHDDGLRDVRLQDVLLTPEEYRKFMSATAGRNPLSAETAPIGLLSCAHPTARPVLLATSDRLNSPSTPHPDRGALSLLSSSGPRHGNNIRANVAARCQCTIP
jgi:hypothetical protein